MKPVILAIDTLDDRREWFELLLRLPPRERLRFLLWACRQTHSPKQRPVPNIPVMKTRIDAALRGDETANIALANEVRMDCCYLVIQYGLDPRKASEELERWVKLWSRGTNLALHSAT